MKLKRNKIYRVCGSIMLGSIVLIAAYSICRHTGQCKALEQYDPVFWMETIALWAFGLSWLTKGKTIYIDEKS